MLLNLQNVVHKMHRLANSDRLGEQTHEWYDENLPLPLLAGFSGINSAWQRASLAGQNVIRNEPSRVSFNYFRPCGNAVLIGENVIR